MTVAQQYDPQQLQLMEEMCIHVSPTDQIIGPISKKQSHLKEVIMRNEALHRAFSVFLFDPVHKKLLLQQRAAEKITFPSRWTNTCCSHPLYQIVSSDLDHQLLNELQLEESLECEQKGVQGIQHAAWRKLKQELGIVRKEGMKMQYLTRIHYQALSDSIWGEHEVDYILFLVADVECQPNPNEVRDIKYVSLEEMKQILKESSDEEITPWFKLICENFLFSWWKQLLADEEIIVNEPEKVHFLK